MVSGTSCIFSPSTGEGSRFVYVIPPYFAHKDSPVVYFLPNHYPSTYLHYAIRNTHERIKTGGRGHNKNYGNKSQLVLFN